MTKKTARVAEEDDEQYVRAGDETAPGTAHEGQPAGTGRQDAALALNSMEQKLSTAGLSPGMEQAIRADLDRLKAAIARWDSGSTAAGTYSVPAAPAEAGPGVLHDDGSYAPDEDAPAVGTTRNVQ